MATKGLLEFKTFSVQHRKLIVERLIELGIIKKTLADYDSYIQKEVSGPVYYLIVYKEDYHNDFELGWNTKEWPDVDFKYRNATIDTLYDDEIVGTILNQITYVDLPNGVRVMVHQKNGVTIPALSKDLVITKAKLEEMLKCFVIKTAKKKK